MADIDWGSRIPAYAGLVLSLLSLWLTYWRGHTRVKLYLGLHGHNSTLRVSNMSPHEVEIVSLGVVEADGSIDDWTDESDPWPGLPKKIPARSEHTFTLYSELASFGAFERSVKGRCGCFVRLAGGRVYSNPGKLRRFWWWILGRFDRQPRDWVK